MPLPRKSLISLSATSYYHCVSRCVRRAYLCGRDKLSGQSYEHRRQWVEDRLLLLGTVFAIDICAYAVMSNHTHIVLCVDKEVAESWSTEQVVQRWLRLHKGTLLAQRYLNPEERKAMSAYELETVEHTASIYRERLYDISWFMRLLNEFIARRANSEDNCTGRFWEGRFKSQALLDADALAACMVYVDLNPIRAGIAKNIESSVHTSINKRIRAEKADKQPVQLKPFIAYGESRHIAKLPFYYDDYVQLVRLAGEHFSSKKRGGISSEIPILDQTSVSVANWYWSIENIETRFTTHISQQLIKQKIARGYLARVG